MTAKSCGQDLKRALADGGEDCEVGVRIDRATPMTKRDQISDNYLYNEKRGALRRHCRMKRR